MSIDYSKNMLKKAGNTQEGRFRQRERDKNYYSGSQVEPQRYFPRLSAPVPYWEDADSLALTVRLQAYRYDILFRGIARDYLLVDLGLVRNFESRKLKHI